MGIGIVDEQQKCLECDRDCKNRRSLGNHVVRSHDTTLQKYVLKHFLNGIIPKCACGCKQEVAWHKCFYRFNDYVTGHNDAGYCASSYKETTEVTIKRIRKIRETFDGNQFLRSKISLAVTEAFKDPVKRQNLSDGQKRGWQDDERKDRQREHAIRLLEQGKIGPQAPFKAEWVENPFTGKKEYMHSSWETAFLNSCSTAGLPVTKSHAIRIPYTSTDGSSHVYIPDFVTVDEWPDRLLFEIKGQRTVVDDIKEKACREWCSENGFELIVVSNKRL